MVDCGASNRSLVTEKVSLTKQERLRLRKELRQGGEPWPERESP